MPKKYKQLRQLAVLTLLIFLPIQLHAKQSNGNESDPLAELKSLVLEQRFNAAYDLAIRLEKDHEGEVDFDLLLGTTSQKNLDWQRSVYAFERILLQVPQNQNARYALAVGYYQLENLDASQVEFERLLSSTLPDAMSDSVAMYLQAIERRKAALQQQWRTWLGTDVGYDDNPNSGVDETFLTLPDLGQVLIFEENQQHSSGFAGLRGKLQYTAPLNQRSSWLAAASVRHINYSNSLSFDRTFANLTLGYQTEISDAVLQVSGFYRALRLEGDSFLDILGADIGAQFPLNARSSIGSNLILTDEQHEQQNNLSKQTASLDLWYQVLSDIGVHNISLRFGQDSGDVSENDLASRSLFGAGYRWHYSFSSSWLYKVDLSIFRADYDEQNPIFQLDREDTFFRGQFETIYSLSDKWMVQANFTYINNDSDLAIYHYNRMRASVGVQYEF